MISIPTRRRVQKGLYLAVIAGLIVFLYRLGVAPWHHVLDNWPIFLGTSLINGVGLFIQAASFREVQPPRSFPLPREEFARIWALSGVMSVIAPILAGLATRTALLVQAGVPLSACLATSIRQMWMGVEYACLIGGTAGLFVELPGFEYLAIGLIVAGLIMAFLRIFAARFREHPSQGVWKWIGPLRMPVALRAHPWFIAQIIAMSAVYVLAFNGFGASISWQEGMLLSAVTILASLVVVIPNGLGIMDALWVLVATRSGLGLEESVALAIIFRLGYLMAAALVWGMLSIIQIRYRTGE